MEKEKIWSIYYNIIKALQRSRLDINLENNMYLYIKAGEVLRFFCCWWWLVLTLVFITNKLKWYTVWMFMILIFAILLNNFETISQFRTCYPHLALFSLRLTGCLTLFRISGSLLHVCRAHEIVLKGSFFNWSIIEGWKGHAIMNLIVLVDYYFLD